MHVGHDTLKFELQNVCIFSGEVIRNQVLGDLARSRYLGLLFDETTDVSITKQLIIYAKIVLDGVSSVRFLGTAKVSNTNC